MEWNVDFLDRNGIKKKKGKREKRKVTTLKRDKETDILKNAVAIWPVKVFKTLSYEDIRSFHGYSSHNFALIS